MTAVFERIVNVKPAYDCQVIQPCVHGSEACGTDPGANHGRHNAEMSMTLRTSDAEVTLHIGTGWELPETPAIVRTDDAPRGACVVFHSSMPQYEGHESRSKRCCQWPVCYSATGYLMADEPTAMLVREGSEAVWAWLESQYRETFADLKAGAR